MCAEDQKNESRWRKSRMKIEFAVVEKCEHDGNFIAVGWFTWWEIMELKFEWERRIATDFGYNLIKIFQLDFY